MGTAIEQDSKVLTNAAPVDDRFEIRERLGAGSMGVVYRAYDRARRIEVALKTLRQVEGSGLFQFKNEFRSLAGIVHPNLATLYELHSVGDSWYFTMELVSGTGFLGYVRPHQHLLPHPTDADADGDTASVRPGMTTAALGSGTASEDTANTADMASGSDSSSYREMWVRRRRVHREALLAGQLDAGRLRAALASLADGVHALHGAGKLHRDIKSSNVLVESDGRVVVCDFGLAVAARSGARDEHPMGTPMYMSPEQAANASLTEASDWYSVGVIMYMALRGAPPFEGNVPDILQQKQVADPAPLTPTDADIPEDLAELCRALMSRDPEARPTGVEVLRRLDRTPVSVVAPPTAQTGAPVPFIGRESLMASMWDALRRVRDGHRASLFVHGPSGIGKSAVVDRFLGEIEASGEAIILRGRCYERESVPFKALDSVVDALAGYLVRLPDEEAAELIPRDIDALRRLFPILERVGSLRTSQRSVISDPQELRLRAFAALRFTLRALAERQPTVLYIDDLQWGDVDSAPFLADLIHHSRAPELLLLASYRSEEVATSPLLQLLLEQQPATDMAGDVQLLEVTPLERLDAERLALEVLGAVDLDARERAAQLAAEAGGHPLFITELARASITGSGDDAIAGLTLDDVIDRRISEVPAGALAMLTASAVVGRPIPVDIVGRAAEVEDEAAALALLQAEQLVRTRTVGAEQLVEPYHDRVRETVVRRLSDRDSRRVHRRLARALESSTRADPLALVELWQGAGDTERAGHYAELAAAFAERALAFDRAAHHYRLVLELRVLEGPERVNILTRLGHTLASGGTLNEAADAYLEAAEHADRLDALELRRLAVEQLLRSGRFEQGVELVEEVLRAIGLRLPKSHRSTLLRVLLGRARVALRGLRFTPRPPEEIDPEALRRVDICWSVSSSLPFVDPLLGTHFQIKQLIHALDTGDPYRAAIALAMEVGFRGLGGGPAQAQVTRVVTRAREVAVASGSEAALGLVVACEGLAHVLRGEFASGHDLLVEGQDKMLADVSSFRWQIDVCHNFHVQALLYLGRTRELARLVPLLLGDAVERGDEYLAASLRSWRSNAAWLVMDDPDEARRQVETAERTHPAGDRFQLVDYYRLLSHAQIDLYTGHGANAWRSVSDAWRRLRKSMLLRIQSVHIEALYLRGRCAVAAAAATSEHKLRATLLRDVERAARELDKQHMRWGDALAALVRGCAGTVAGDAERATANLERALAVAGEADMALHAAAAAYRLGELRGDAAGAAAAEEAADWMRSEDVRAPEKLVEVFAPTGSRTAAGR